MPNIMEERERERERGGGGALSSLSHLRITYCFEFLEEKSVNPS